MTPDELRAVKVGDDVSLRDERGRVTQTTRIWFMVMWPDGVPQVIRRDPTILTQWPKLTRP